MRTLLFLLLLAALITAQEPKRPASGTQGMYDAAARSAEQKFSHLEENARRPKPDQTPTVLTAREINAYLDSGRVKLPTGVHRVRFQSQPSEITASANVDFEEVKAGRRSSNPLLSLFSGVHEVQVVARAEGSGGIGRVDVQSVSIDGVNVPRMALEYFIDRYLRPKYPQVDMHSEFRMPARIDVAQVGENQLTVTQK